MFALFVVICMQGECIRAIPAMWEGKWAEVQCEEARAILIETPETFPIAECVRVYEV